MTDFGMKKGAEEFPLMVCIPVTLACNSRCVACPYTQNPQLRKNGFFPPKLFSDIARQCGEYGALMRITGGEPFVHPQLVPMVEHAKSVGAKVGIITNGSLLDGSYAYRLLSCDVDVIEVSVDAADKETYSKIRVGLDFDKVLANVRYLAHKRGKMGSGTKLIASIVDQQAISGKIEEIVSFWEKIVDEVQVRKYLTWGVSESKAGNDTPLMEDRVPCPLPFERMVLDSEGKVVLCNFDIAGKMYFGDTAVSSIKEIWRGKRLEGVREKLLAGRFEDVPLCKDCPDWKFRSWDHNYWKVLDKAERKRRAEQ